MNGPFQQDERLGRLETALGRDVLVLLRFTGEDRLNDLFTYTVEALATRDDLDFDALLGTHAAVTVEGRDGPVVFDGIVTEVAFRGPGENGWRYELTLRPWIFLAGLRRNQRIFHEKTVVQILQELLSPYAHLGSPHLEVRLSHDYPVLEYTVQYSESDLNFATRQLERFGISYHFEHRDSGHTLVLTDDATTHKSIGKKPYHAANQRLGNLQEHFWDWGPLRRVKTGAIRLTDYNFKTPSAVMEVDQTSEAQHAEGQIEAYDYPGDYLDQGQGSGVAARRLDAERGQDQRYTASGDTISLKPGGLVDLGGGDFTPGDGETHLCLSARYTFVSQAYGSGGAANDKPFEATYTLTPSSAPMMPERKTPRPIIHGPQTAVVVGDGEIDCDEYGRILVRFHWDLAGANSMRCRVSQSWASKGWGGMVIPRIGMEVVVEHLEGDPDKPLVTGCVYNGKNDTPYPLPANKTKSVFRTDTHSGGSFHSFNELTFEDEKGREEVFLRASRDWTVKVDQHATLRIDDNEVRSVGGHLLSEVEMSRKETVGNSYAISVGGGAGGALINGSDRKDPFGLRPAAYRLGLGHQGGRGNFTLDAENNVNFDVGGALAMDTEGYSHERVGGGKSSNVAKALRVSVGGDSKEVISGRKVIDAHKELLIRCGKSMILLKPDGRIEIKCDELLVDSSATIKMKSDRIDLN